ncbi:M56 family metallopeptidase [Streptomyces sp. NPDC087917]|uniref:M56 family metallopeptidase n=1 Tax=Streptomyces sp. NPDC087917 TaxID=3155060 RepID=UPI0034355C45
MIHAVWLPLVLPFLAGPAGRRLAVSLPPRQALRLLTLTAAGLAIGSACALALLIVPGATHLHAVAASGHLLAPLASGSPDAVIAVAVTAATLLSWCATLLVRAADRRRRRLRQARGLAARSDGELVVLADDHPDAYALPGRPGRIVVTTGMLRALSAPEREVLLAHERAHLKDRHHLFTAVVDLAGLCHPGLRALREPLAYAVERSADESAATSVGDRRLTARAIGRAALAARTSSTAGRPRPGAALAATAGPVPKRVAALLGDHRLEKAARPLVRRAAAAALLTCLALSAGASLQAADDLHAGIEIAQGESP